MMTLKMKHKTLSIVKQIRLSYFSVLLFYGQFHPCSQCFYIAHVRHNFSEILAMICDLNDCHELPCKGLDSVTS